MFPAAGIPGRAPSPCHVRGALSGLGPCSSRRSRPLVPLRRCGLTLRRDRRVAGALRLGKALQRTRKGPPPGQDGGGGRHRPESHGCFTAPSPGRGRRLVTVLSAEQGTAVETGTGRGPPRGPRRTSRPSSSPTRHGHEEGPAVPVACPGPATAAPTA